MFSPLLLNITFLLVTKIAPTPLSTLNASDAIRTWCIKFLYGLSTISETTELKRRHNLRMFSNKRDWDYLGEISLNAIFVFTVEFLFTRDREEMLKKNKRLSLVNSKSNPHKIVLFDQWNLVDAVSLRYFYFYVIQHNIT